jgi:hypothetical protein
MEKTHELLANGKVFWANFELIASMNEEESDKTTIKAENRNRNEENRRQIIDFIADNRISDAKSISKAIVAYGHLQRHIG